MHQEPESIDRLLFAIVIGLVLFGVVMVYSASAPVAEQLKNDRSYFLIRQSIWALAGISAMLVVMHIDYRLYKRSEIMVLLLVLCLSLLVVVLFFPPIKGARRWIRYGPFQSQPSEMAKLVMIFYLAFLLERRQGVIRSFGRTFLPCVLMSGLLMGLVLAERDLGTVMIMGLVLSTMIYVVGVPWRYQFLLTTAGLAATCYQLISVDYRIDRIMTFLAPWRDPTGKGFQPIQSMIAIGSGGISGLGFTEGKQKLLFLPMPHTDFIFSVIGEELGLIGGATLVLVFGLLFWRGLRASLRAPDMFGKLLGLGISVMIVTQALLNISVAVSLMPTKGITLPFVSYGGSSLLFSLIGVGMLLNISRYSHIDSRLRA